MKQQIMMIQKMIHHSHADAARDGPEDDKKMIAEYDPDEIDDEDVSKIPMTYRVSPVNCTVVIVVVYTIVEYLPS